MTQAIPMLLWCPECSTRHIDAGDFVTREHHTHACQECGHVWRPAIVPTTGVRFLPGFGPPDDPADHMAWLAELPTWRDTWPFGPFPGRRYRK